MFLFFTSILVFIITVLVSVKLISATYKELKVNNYSIKPIFQAIILLIVFKIVLISRFLIIKEYFNAGYDYSTGSLLITGILGEKSHDSPTLFFIISFLPLTITYYIYNSICNTKISTLLVLPQFIILLIAHLFISDFIDYDYQLEFYNDEKPFVKLILFFQLFNTLIIISRLISNYKFSTALKNWVLALTFITTITVFRAYFSSYGYSHDEIFNVMIEYGGHSNVFMALLSVFMLFNNRILNGDIYYEDKFLSLKNNSFDYSTINKNLIVWDFKKRPIWIKNKSENNKILKYIENNEYVLASKIYDFESNYLNDGYANLKEFDKFNFSQELNIQIDILETYFKINCKYSIIQYLKMIRVIRSEILIKKGYLINNTVDNLANITGFNNRVSLYNNYKKFLNSSPAISKTKT